VPYPLQQLVQPLLAEIPNAATLSKTNVHLMRNFLVEDGRRAAELRGMTIARRRTDR